MPAEQGMERLIIEYGDAVLRMCFLYLKDYHLAEDAAQETFIKAMKHYDSFNRKSSEKTWLTRIAINCCKNIMRMNWFRLGRGQLEENIQTVATDPIEKVCGSIFMQTVRCHQSLYYIEITMVFSISTDWDTICAIFCFFDVLKNGIK
mgnify:CR=1 FL=1